MGGSGRRLTAGSNGGAAHSAVHIGADESRLVHERATLIAKYAARAGGECHAASCRTRECCFWPARLRLELTVSPASRGVLVMFA